MDRQIKMALIGGFFLILSVIVGWSVSVLLTPVLLSPNVEIVDFETLYSNNYFEHYSPELGFTKVLSVNNSYLDFKVKNSGNEIAIIKSVEIKVLNNCVDYSPNLVFTRRIKPHEISLLIENLGWSPATNVTLNDIYYSRKELIPILGLRNDRLIWKGDINEGSQINIVHRYDKDFKISNCCTCDQNATFFNLSGKIEYRDVYGNYYINFVGSEVIAIENNSICLGPCPAAATLPPSAIYKAFLKSELKTPYTIKIPVSHELPPNTADRFLIKLDSDKTATYDIIVHIDYDITKMQKTKSIEVKVGKLNTHEVYCPVAATFFNHSILEDYCLNFPKKTREAK